MHALTIRHTDNTDELFNGAVNWLLTHKIPYTSFTPCKPYARPLGIKVINFQDKDDLLAFTLTYNELIINNQYSIINI